MALSKKSPKGVQNSDWNKIRSIYYLIDNNIIVRDPSMGSYTDAPSYHSNRAKGAKEFIKHYHSEYPKLFKKGKAGSKLEDYVSRTKGRLQIKAKLQEFQDEGLIELPDFKYIDTQAQKQKSMLKQLDLSGGIFDTLTGKSADLRADTRALHTLQDSLFPYAVKQSDANYNLYKGMLPSKHQLTEPSFVEYNSLGSLLSEDGVLAGPVRAMMASYLTQLRASRQVLRSLETTSGENLSSTMSSKVRDLINMARGVGSILAQKDLGSVEGNTLESATTKFFYTIPNTDEQKPDSPWDAANCTLADINGLNADGLTKTTAITAMKMIVRMVFGKVKVGDAQVADLFSKVKTNLIQKQQNALLDIRKDVINGNIYSRQTIAADLQDAYIKARSALKEGGIDEKAYRSIEKSLKMVRGQADSLPKLGTLVEALQDGDLAKVRDAKYKSLIIAKTIENLSSQLDQAKDVAAKVKMMKENGVTTEQVVANLQKIYNLVSPALEVMPSELSTTQPGMASAVTWNFQTQGIKADAASVAVKGPELAKAKSAVRSVKNGLAQARRSSNERALQIYAYLIVAQTAKFKLDLKIAYDIAREKTQGDMGKIISSQEAAYNLLTGNDATAVKHRVDRVVKFYMPSNPMMASNFINYGGKNQIIFAAAQVKSDLGKDLLGATNVAQVAGDIVDPGSLLSTLPSNVRSMTQQQAQARAIAITIYMGELFSRFGSTCDGFLASQVASMNYEDQRKAFQKQLSLLKEMLKSAKVDSSLRNKEVVSFSAGLHFVGFTPKYTMEANAMNTPTMAILTPGDLLQYSIFRGQTYTDMEGSILSRQYPQRQRPLQSQQEMTYGTAGNDGYWSGKPYERRPITNVFGKTVSIPWTPIQANDLRNRFFISLYPYDLRNARFNKIYQQQLNLLRGKGGITDAQGDILVQFGLAAAPTSGGSSNRFGSRNRRW
jgi:hypothetical protein